MKTTITKISFLFGTFLLLFSCLKNEDYPVTPNIELSNVKFYGTDPTSPDSARIFFSFTDGDGDLGTTDTIPNCFIEYYEKDGDTVKAFPTLTRKLTFPVITPEAKNKSIKGEMNIIIEPAPIFNILTTEDFKWKVYITDRAGNKSNLISTPLYNKKSISYN